MDIADELKRKRTEFVIGCRKSPGNRSRSKRDLWRRTA